MHSLYQRLRELDWDTFQRLTFQLISARHPGLNLRHVEGAGGDKGLDFFEGQLTGRPIIWQCKQFSSGFSAQRRPQVKDSLKRVLEHFRPSQWILVLSVDLDATSQEWFQNLASEYSHETALGSFQASDIVRELIHRRNIRETFFPDAVIDSVMIRRSLEGGGDLDLMSLERISRSGIDEQIARLEEADARFNYRISYAPNVGADIIDDAPVSSLHIGVLSQGDKRIDIFARDVAALRLDPPKIHFSVKDKGVEKLAELLKTGKPQIFSADELVNVEVPLGFLAAGDRPTPSQMHIGPPTSLTSQVFSWRITFADSTETVTYDLLKVRVIALGSEQFEVESTSQLPFVLKITLPRTSAGTGNLQISDSYSGHDLQTLSKALRAKRILFGGGHIKLHSLDADVSLGEIGFVEDNHQLQFWENMMIEAASIAQQFEVTLPVPETITDEDLHSIALLSSLVKGKLSLSGTIPASICKQAGTEEYLRENASVDFNVSGEVSGLQPIPVLFGKEIATGPLVIQSKKARLISPEDSIEQCRESALGETIVVRFEFTETEVTRATGLDRT